MGAVDSTHMAYPPGGMKQVVPSVPQTSQPCQWFQQNESEHSWMQASTCCPSQRDCPTLHSSAGPHPASPPNNTAPASSAALVQAARVGLLAFLMSPV